MKAIAIDRYGGREVLEFRDVPERTPKYGEVLIGIRAAGVNPVDWKIRQGLLATRMPNIFPITLGLDFAGVVLSCGDGVSRVKTGDRVFGYARKDVLHEGTYAERIVLPETSVSRLPDVLSFEEGASVPLAALTSWQALFESGGLQRGQSVLIHAGAGGTGGFAIQMARWAGAKVITTSRSVNHAYVRSLGADYAIDYSTQDTVQAVRALCPSGIDLVYDTVGGATQKASADLLRPNGILVSILAFADEAALQAKGIQTRYLFVRPVADHLDSIARLITEGILKTHVDHVYPWTEVKRAHERIEAGHNKGKIVLVIS